MKAMIHCWICWEMHWRMKLAYQFKQQTKDVGPYEARASTLKSDTTYLKSIFYQRVPADLKKLVEQIATKDNLSLNDMQNFLKTEYDYL